ncbi:MAG: hypothetical protein KF865_14890 [Bdellovibrionaceae bacterium]|nr:hypothetical protein [Pseudobdellovibrionaceae bacterium]
MSLFTPKVFQWILQRKPDAEWGVARFAKEPEKFKARIDQFNRMWDALPVDFQKKLKPNLLSSTERSFRGALSELIAYTVLRSWYMEIHCDPRIGTLTPDFYVMGPLGKRAFIAEVFSLGPHETHKKYRWAIARLMKALRGFQSPFHLNFKIGGTIGTSLDWVTEKLQAYLAAYSDDGDTEKVHHIEDNGQHIFFNIGPRAEGGSGFFGYLSQVMSGDPQVKNLTDRLEQKVEKYRFPFLAICVTDSLGTADRHTLLEAMIGHIHMQVPVNLGNSEKTGEEETWAFADDGFWGIGNPRIADHLGVQGLLFIEPQYEEDTSFTLHLHFVENPHIHSSVGSDLTGVPDLLKHVKSQGTYEVPGFRLKP